MTDEIIDKKEDPIDRKNFFILSLAGILILVLVFVLGYTYGLTNGTATGFNQCIDVYFEHVPKEEIVASLRYGSFMDLDLGNVSFNGSG